MTKNLHVPLIKKFTLLSSIVILTILFSAFVLAAPLLPATYYGSAIINERDAPVNSVITAVVDGVEKSSLTVTVEGKMGGPLFNEGKLSVQDADKNDKVYFFIQTAEMSNKIQAFETATWETGAFEEINLTFTGIEVPKGDEDDDDDNDRRSSGSSGSSGGSGGGGSSLGSTTTITVGGDEPEEEEEDSEEDEEEVVVAQQTNIQVLSSGSGSYTLSKGEQINVVVDGQTYSIIVKAVGIDSAILTISGVDQAVKKDQSFDVDLDSDGQIDLSLTLNNLNNNDITLAGTIIEPEPLSITGAAINNLVKFQKPLIGSIIIIIIVVLGLAVYFFLSGKK